MNVHPQAPRPQHVPAEYRRPTHRESIAVWAERDNWHFKYGRRREGVSRRWLNLLEATKK